MRALTALLFSAVIAASVAAQEAPPGAEREAVLSTVQAFFDTMAARDAGGARRVLVPEGRFHSVRTRDGKTVTRIFTNQEYLDDLGSAKGRVRERMWNPEVRVRGNIATVWTPYDFWTGGKFSHCGIDAFSLVRDPDGWKIAGGSYTVETTCEPSPLGPLKP